MQPTPKLGKWEKEIKDILNKYAWNQEDHSVMSTISYERSIANARINHKEVTNKAVDAILALLALAKQQGYAEGKKEKREEVKTDK